MSEMQFCSECSATLRHVSQRKSNKRHQTDNRGVFHKRPSDSQFIRHLGRFRRPRAAGILFYVRARYRLRPRVKLRPL